MFDLLENHTIASAKMAMPDQDNGGGDADDDDTGG